MRSLWRTVRYAGIGVMFGVLGNGSGAPTGSLTVAAAQSLPIQHVIVIMQENRSFDSYFGTFPGADGIPMQNGVPTVCVDDPATNQCVAPYHDANDRNLGGPHGEVQARMDINGGKMDGFIAQEHAGRRQACAATQDPSCSQTGQTDVMGYHDQREIPNYWSYAQQFVLQDRMFEPNASWSLPAHLFTVSGWSARCPDDNPMRCTNNLQLPSGTAFLLAAPARRTGLPMPRYAWTDVTYLLHQAGVSWAYYLDEGAQPDCEDDAMFCESKPQGPGVPGIWNPLPWFDTVQQDNELGNIQPHANFYAAARAGTLPAVVWIVPSQPDSEHPPALVSAGQAYVTSIINAVMQSPNWNTTAIFLTWDDWGGFRSEPAGQRASACTGQRRSGVRDQHHQRGHAEPQLEYHCHFPYLGRLGRLLRSRGSADRRRQRLRLAGAWSGDQPIRAAGRDRPPDSQLRRLPQVHRRCVSGRPAPRPRHRRTAGPASDRPRKRGDPRRSHAGLRLYSSTAPAGAAARTALASRLWLRSRCPRRDFGRGQLF